MKTQLSVLTGLILCLTFTANSVHAQADKTAGVFAQTLELREFSSRIEALGTLAPKEQVNLTLNASDRVEAIYFEDGQRVVAGQKLLTLAQSEQRALVEAEEAKVSEAQQQLDRVNRLVVRKAVSQSEVDEAQRDLDSAKAQLRAVQSRQKDRVLVAPFDGVLGFRQVSVGSFVQPGNFVARLIDDSEMNLEFSVPSTFLRFIKPNTPVTASTDDRPNEIFNGVVDSVDNSIDPVTRTVKVRAKIPNTERLLLTGMFMEVTLIADARSVAAVPEESIQPIGPRNFVYIIETSNEQQVARKTEVTLGVYQDGYVEVLSGVNVGDTIITEGVIKVRDGGLVKVQSKSILEPSTSSSDTTTVSPLPDDITPKPELNTES